MTAASGVVHEEKHSQKFSEDGGTFEMVQLWVNLPASKKMSEPRYQPLLDKDFPRLDMGAAEGRLVAGTLQGQTGPAKTHTPITLLDLRFHEDGVTELTLPTGWTTLVFPLEGDVAAGPDRERIPSQHFGAFDRESHGPVQINAKKDARVLVLAGEPLNEGRRIAESTLTAIMGRMTAYTGKVVTWDFAMKSKLDLTPEQHAFGPMPMPPVAMPGKTALV